MGFILLDSFDTENEAKAFLNGYKLALQQNNITEMKHLNFQIFDDKKTPILGEKRYSVNIE